VELEELVDLQDAPQVAVFTVLVNARLIAAGPHHTWTLAHPSLTTRWETLARWINTYAEQLAALERATQAADMWSHHGHDVAFLGSDALVAEAQQAATALLPRTPTTLGDYLDASRRHVRQRAARRRLALGAVVLLGIAAAGVAFGIRPRTEQPETRPAVVVAPASSPDVEADASATSSGDPSPAASESTPAVSATAAPPASSPAPRAAPPPAAPRPRLRPVPRPAPEPKGYDYDSRH
jgi:hypothetical protein